MLDRYGVAVVPSVLSEGEISAMNAGMWDTLEQTTSKFRGDGNGFKPVSRQDPSTWRGLEGLMP
eukprot:246423-Rhodomonas_salina.2